jgi:DMSO reductase family type II enzyme heme b subunit
MKVAKVSAPASELADPAAAVWSGVAPEAVSLQPVPLSAQPTEYIREAWANKAYGRTAEAMVAAASDGKQLYLRVEWEDDEAPNSEFADAVAGIFPSNGTGALGTLGNAESPLTMWYWENGRPGPMNLTARGPGVFRKDGSVTLGASGALNEGRWSVVISGPAEAARSGKLGVAVWNGSNDERAGLAAVSRDWLTLELA